MGIEGGGGGAGGGGVGGGPGGGAGGGFGGGIGGAAAGIGGGIEAGAGTALGGAASVSGPEFSVPTFGAASRGAELGSTVDRLGGVRAQDFDFGPTWVRAEIGTFSMDTAKPAGEIKNTMPLQIGQNNPVKEIKFNTPVEGEVPTESFSAQSAITEAEAMLTQIREASLQSPSPLKEAEVLAEANQILGATQAQATEEVKGQTAPVEHTSIRPTWLVVSPRIESQVMPRVVPGVLESLQPTVIAIPGLEMVTKYEAAPAVATRTENSVSTKTASAVSRQTGLQNREQEEVVEEQILTEQAEEKETGNREDEDEQLIKIEFTEAVQVSENRRQYIREAIKKLGLGRKFREVLSVGFWKSKSPIVKEGKDWTLDLTVQEIESDRVKYQTPKLVEEAYVKAVERNIPVQEGKGGRIAAVEEVKKVLNGERKEPKTPARIVIKRVMKKSVIEKAEAGEQAGVLEKKTDAAVEGTLKDLNLEEVFLQKAA